MDLVEVTTTPVGGVAERGADRAGLGHVALRGGGGVGVDVPDVAGRQVGLAERELHRPGGAEARGVGLGDVVRVGGDPGAGGLGVHRGPARLGVLGGLEDDAGGALAEHEAVAALVPGPRGGLRVVVALGQRHHLAEGGHRQRVDRGLGAAADDDVGAAEPDQVDAQGDRLVAGRARRDRRVHARLGADGEPDVGRGGVGHQHRDRQRRHPAGALLLERVVVGEQGLHAADARGHGHGESLRLDARRRRGRCRPRPPGRRPSPAGPTGRAGGP